MTNFMSSYQVSAKHRSIARKLSCVVFALTMFAGCTVGPKYHVPASPILLTRNPRLRPAQ